MYIIGLLLAIVVGVTLGMIGSGGSILTVPILVYIMGVNPVLATSYSLLIIGTTSLIGAAKGIKEHTVDFSKVVYFGLPSMITVFVVRSYILPLVPEEIVVGGYSFHQDNVLMVLFASIMLLSAIPMIKGRKEGNGVIDNQDNILTIVFQGMLVGFVTGVVGAGGGFLIIPVLVNSFGLTLKRAVSTSLLLITINSTIGLLGDIDRFSSFDWQLIIIYIILSIIGLFIGFKVSSRIDNAVLKRGFGVGIFMVSMGILIHELFI